MSKNSTQIPVIYKNGPKIILLSTDTIHCSSILSILNDGPSFNLQWTLTHRIIISQTFWRNLTLKKPMRLNKSRRAQHSSDMNWIITVAEQANLLSWMTLTGLLDRSHSRHYYYPSPKVNIKYAIFFGFMPLPLIIRLWAALLIDNPTGPKVYSSVIMTWPYTLCLSERGLCFRHSRVNQWII